MTVCRSESCSLNRTAPGSIAADEMGGAALMLMAVVLQDQSEPDAKGGRG